jgi:hypothetical protein
VLAVQRVARGDDDPVAAGRQQLVDIGGRDVQVEAALERRKRLLVAAHHADADRVGRVTEEWQVEVGRPEARADDADTRLTRHDALILLVGRETPRTVGWQRFPE